MFRLFSFFNRNGDELIVYPVDTMARKIKCKMGTIDYLVTLDDDDDDDNKTQKFDNQCVFRNQAN